MAKYEKYLIGDFDTVLARLDRGILNGSISATYEDGSDFKLENDVRCAVRVYERFSYIGGNRVSLNLTLLGSGQRLFLSVITSGGSSAVFWKINTWGEESFLETLINVIESEE